MDKTLDYLDEMIDVRDDGFNSDVEGYKDQRNENYERMIILLKNKRI